MSVLAMRRGEHKRLAVQGWRPALIALGALWLGLLVLFRRDAADMATIWWSSSTFEHCLLIVPILGWLVWQRAAVLRSLTPTGWVPGLALVAVGAGGWLLGQAAGVALARHLGLVLMLQGAVLATLGPSAGRVLAFPLGYALFLVPAGDGLVAPLQTLTARMCMVLLDLSGIPARLDGVFITTPTGWFEVAEACSGAKFLIAMVALGVLVAHLGFRSWQRRALFMAAAVIVPILANGLRAFGTIVVAHWTDSRVAVGFDHVVYGWVFFGVVIAILLGGSWRFFDRAPGDVPAGPVRVASPAPRSSIGAAVMAALVAAAPVAWSGAIAAGGGPLVPGSIALPAPAGWQVIARDRGLDWTPSFPGADRFELVRYRDAGGQEVDLAVAAYGDQREGRELVGFGIGAVGEGSAWAWASDGAAIANGRAMRIVAPGDTVRDVAIFYRVGDIVSGSATRVKLETLRTHLLGGPQRAVAVLVSAQAPRGGSARPAIDRFLRAIGPVEALADRAAR